MTVQSAPSSDEQHGFDDIDAPDGADAFLAQMLGDEVKKKPPSTDPEAEATDDAPEETTEGVTEENTEGTEEATKDADPDDAEIEIKVGDEVKKATLKDLKRLYGQEASLTQKSQKVAEAQRAADAVHARANAGLGVMLQKAQERAKPYQDMDWLVLSQRMNTEDFQALRADAAAAQTDLTFLQTELDGVVKSQRDEALKAHQTAAQECLKALSDPSTGIKDFGQPVYTEMMKFASDNGLPEAIQMVNPGALKLLHMAMLYAKSQTTQAAAAQKAAKAVQQATRVLKSGTSSQPTTAASARQKDAMRALKNSGSEEDAAMAFFARSRSDD
jgi:hypothetical protein